MSQIIIAILILLWIFGYINVPGIDIPNPTLFTINSQPITLIKVITFAIILWALEILPSPLRQVAFVLLALWLLSILGFIAIANFSNIMLIALIVALLYSRK